MPRHVLVLVLFMSPALAQSAPGPSLTLTEAIARAKSAAPSIVSARLRIEEARAGLIGPSLRFSSNPSIEIEAGRRSGDTATPEYGVTVEQELDLPGTRRARLAIARSRLVQEEQRTREVERQAIVEVARVFLLALEARERTDASAASRQLAEEALDIARRRYAAGDVAQLDVNLARAAVARTASESQISEATLAGLRSTLQVLLALDAPPQVSGSLRDPLEVEGADLVRSALTRGDLQLLDAELAEAEAGKKLAAGLRWPQFGLRATAAEEEGDRILLGGVGFTLPVFHRGQEERALADARLLRLRAERDALRRTITAQVEGASATVDALRKASTDYEKLVLPLIAENETLALESYEAGQVGLADLLVVRNEALDARLSLLDQLIRTRLAEVELRALAGVNQ